MKKSKLIFNPFERYSIEKLITIGSIALIIGSLLGFYFKGHFDGALDLHFDHTISLKQAFLGNAVSTLCLFLAFGIVGKIIYSKTRWIDVLAVSLVARLPLYILTFTNFKDINYELGQALMLAITNPERNIPMDAIIISSIFGFVALVFAVWMIILLYNGFKLITNGKGIKYVLSFITAIIISEIISKTILYFIY